MIAVKAEQKKEPTTTNTLTLSFHVPLAWETLTQTITVQGNVTSQQSNLSISQTENLSNTLF